MRTRGGTPERELGAFIRGIAVDMFLQAISADEVIDFKVASFNSMWPIFSADDVISVKSIPLGEIKRGEIAVYNAGKRIYAHRCIDKIKIGDELCIRAKGDHAWRFDRRPVSQKAFLGKIVSFRKKDKVYDCETLPWKIGSYCIWSLSSLEGRVIAFCDTIKNHFLKNKKSIFLTMLILIKRSIFYSYRAALYVFVRPFFR
jgi:signal peptidase I